MASCPISNKDGVIRFKGVNYYMYPGKAYYYFTMLGERSKKVFGEEFNRLQSEQKPSLKRETAKAKTAPFRKRRWLRRWGK